MGNCLSDGEPECLALSCMPSCQAGFLSKSYVSDQETAFTLREKALSWSGDDFVVYDQLFRKALIFDAKAFSFNGSRRILDPSGGHLFTARRKNLSFRPVWRLELPGMEGSADSKHDCEATIIHSNRGSWGGGTFEIYRRGELVLVCEASKLGHAFTFLTPHRTAVIAQSSTSWGQHRSANTYRLRCGPLADQILLIFACVVIDECLHD
uniref:Tubby C-terminal domain-containing protein n=1 Tax=Chromera velia CCMP2878 TaxID=1169474 RepID=A0A0G4HJV9_9ALVE|eukprot:Cvel_7192.t1-p1 / transcript=Cvel_7192.t1 / gene=Cvel_7192 / organism=Chromera_velia_CCMP2878 / gene_product=hypothetical protein / transcript_product=hypothetical protein / location=Cvel_scaffold370:13853-15050(-) / protein_length=208 / sequence_SO=supercontig / SO=protein_coding / is_pseudo=false